MELYSLLPDESIELRAFKIGEDKRHQIFVHSWDELYERAAKIDQDYDVYFGVAPRTAGDTGEFLGGNEGVARVPVVWLDADVKDGFTREDRLAQLAEWEPTYVIDSGSGYHAYWVLSEDVPPSRARDFMTALSTELHCDKTSDPARILRVPNTINHKGGKRRFVSVVSNGGPVRPIFELERRLSVPIESLNEARNHGTRVDLLTQHGLDAKGGTIEGEVFEGRNAAIFEVACWFRDQNIEQTKVLDICASVNERFRPPLPKVEVKRTVVSAFTREAPPLITEIVEPERPQSVTNDIVIEQQRPNDGFVTTSIHDLGEPSRPVWLWEPYFLLNRLVLLDGEEGIGKGLLLCLLAAKFSKDFPFIWFTAEDDPQDDIKPRIRSVIQRWGGSMSDVNVHFVKGDPRFNDENKRLFDMLERTIEKTAAKVMVFDPGRSFIGPREGQKDFSYNNEADIRPTMQKLNTMSSALQIAIPFVHHHNKNAAAPLRYRTTGTGAWRQVVRHQVTMLWDYTVNDGVFGVQKSNIGPTGFVRPYKVDVVDDYGVLVPSEELDPAGELEIWAAQRAKSNRSSIVVMEHDEIVEQVRDWGLANLAPGDDFPARTELMKQVNLGLEPAKLAIKTLREEQWIGRPKGRQGGGYIWTPPAGFIE